MATEIQKNSYRSLLHPSAPETKRQCSRTLKERINPLDQPPTRPLSNYSVLHFAESVSNSLFTLGTRCLDIATEILLTKAEEFSEWAYQGLKDIPSLNTKTPQDIDYAHDKTFWHAHFYSMINELTSSSDTTRLKSLQNLVWAGFLSPYLYEEGLKDLHWPPATVQASRQQFRHTLNNCPIVIEKGLYEDLKACLRSHTELKEVLDYYRSLMNPLDYKNTLSVVIAFVKRNKKELSWSHKTYQSTIAALNEAIAKTHTETRKNLKQARALFNQLAKELPFYFTEIDANGVWANVKENISKKEALFTADLSTISEAFTRVGKKGIRYITAHPLQAMTAILANQVAATAALNALTSPREQRRSVVPRETNGAVGNEFPVNTYTTGDQQYPTITSLLDGGFVVTWMSHLQDGDGWDVYGKRFAVDGTEIALPSSGKIKAAGNEFPVNTYILYDQQNPTITSLPDGGFVVAWMSYSQALNWDGAVYNIYGKRFAANGTEIALPTSGTIGAADNEFPLNTIDEIYPTIASLKDGGFVVISESSNDGSVFGKRFTANGTTADPFLIAGSGQYPIITSLKDGGFVVIWQNGLSDGCGICGKRFAANGTGGAVFPVALNEPTARTITALVARNEPTPLTITALSDGGFVVTWQNGEDIFGKRFAANGAEIALPTSGTSGAPDNAFPISTNTTNNQQNPAIASLPDGGFVVTWMRDSQDGNGFGIYGKRFAANGTEVALPTSGTGGASGNEFPVNSYTIDNQQYPTITSLSDGGFVVTWMSNGQDGTGYGIYGKRFAANGIEVALPTSGIFATTGTTGPITTGSVTTGTTGTTSPITTGPVTTGTSGTTSPITTGPVTTGTSGTTASRLKTNRSSDDNSSTDLIASLVAALGGVALIAVGGILARKHYILKCSSSQNKEKEDLNLTELNPHPFGGFAPTQQGISTHPSVAGTLNRTPYALWEQISLKEAAMLETILYRSIPFVPDSSHQNKMTFHLGKGQFGETFLAFNLATKELVAVKRVRGENQITESLQEGKIQNELAGSPYIMPLLDYLHFSPPKEDADQKPYLFQFMPLALINGVAYKTLASSLVNQDLTLHKRLLTTHTFQLLKGLNFMHNQSIYHSDMKDANILFMPDFTLKIADFGRAMKLENGMVDEKGSLGDRRKFAPEQLSFIRHRWKQERTDAGPGETVATYAAGPADLWSGILFMLETMGENEPFGESIATFRTKVTEWTNESFQKVIDQQKVLQEASDQNLTGLISNILQADPKKRVDSEKALKWPVFKTVKILDEKEGADLLKNLMNAPKSQTNTSQTFNSNPYGGAIAQQEREVYYNYTSESSSKQPYSY